MKTNIKVMVGGSRIMNEFVVSINGSVKRIKIIDAKSIEVDNVRLNYSYHELDSTTKLFLRLKTSFMKHLILKKVDDELSAFNK